MNGLDMIISQIGEEAENSAAGIIREAEEKARTILEEGEQTCREIEKEAEQKAASLRENILTKSRSAARMERRRELLREKQKLIGEVLDEAKQSLSALDGREYFTLIAEMLKKYAQPGEGEICFNERDLNRLPEGFEETISEIAGAKGGSLTLSRTPCGIGGGFILVTAGSKKTVLSILFSRMRRNGFRTGYMKCCLHKNTAKGGLS